MTNPVAAGLSTISLLNLSHEQVVRETVVLEVYDGQDRIQIEFDDLSAFHEVLDLPAEEMIAYFRDHLFESPEMDDPLDALARMAAASADEGLITVPPEDEDEALFEAMTTIFQNAADYANQQSSNAPAPEGDFLQSLVRDQSSES